MIALSGYASGTVVPVRAQPGARKEGVTGEHNGAVRIAVHAAPEHGKANGAIARVLASVLGCKASQVTLLTGAGSREKKFLVADLDVETVQARLTSAVRGGNP